MKRTWLLSSAIFLSFGLGACASDDKVDVTEQKSTESVDQEESVDSESASSTIETELVNKEDEAREEDDVVSSSSNKETTDSKSVKQESTTDSTNQDLNDEGASGSEDNEDQNPEKSKSTTNETKPSDTSKSSDQSQDPMNEGEATAMYDLIDVDGTAVEVLPGVYAVSVPLESLKVEADHPVQLKVGEKVYDLVYEQEAEGFANLYINDSTLEELQKGKVLVG